MLRITAQERPGKAFYFSLPIRRPSLRYCFVMPIDDLQQAAQKIAGFLSTLNKLGGMRLKYRISAPEAAPGGEERLPPSASSWADRTCCW